MTKKLAFTCGGTGGHVTPAIALIQAMPDVKCTIVGSIGRVDQAMVNRYGIPFWGIVRPFRTRLPWGIIKAVWWLRRESPSAVIATGGQITLCLGLAAVMLRIPLIVLEQNSIAGRTNRLLHRFSTLTITSFSPTKGMDGPRIRCLGNPVRKWYQAEPWLSDVLQGMGSWILVVGGSQGASAINHAIMMCRDTWLGEGTSVVHIMGPNGYANHGHTGTHTIIEHPSGARYMAAPYIEGMDQLYRGAKVVVSRAGATTIAELVAFQVPSVLVPYPHAMDQHQDANAQMMIHQGWAIGCNESELPQLDTLVKTAQTFRLPSVTQSSRDEIAHLIRHLCNWPS